jgi:predicted DNA-binding transcriptional regulator AlpA
MAADPPRFLNKRQVLEMLGKLSRPTFNRWIGAGAFPRGVRISARIILWRMDVVLDWIAQRELDQDKEVSDEDPPEGALREGLDDTHPTPGDGT